MNKWEFVTRRLPVKPKQKTVAQAMRLTKKAMANELWAAQVNDDCSMEMASEVWARCAELVEMIEGRQPIDRELIASLKVHRAHVVKCRIGSCEHEYAALVRAGLER